VLGTRRSFHTAAQHDGSAHVEVAADAYCYVVTERGTELERRRTRDPEELRYWLLSDVVFSLASEYELKHRIAGQDFRRLLFQKQVDLMGQLNPGWSERRTQEIQGTLSTHAYDDIARG
jgi:hypothetical protein